MYKAHLECEHIIQIYSRCVPESSSSPKFWPPNQGCIPTDPNPSTCISRKQRHLNAFHQTSWSGFASYPRMTDIGTSLRILDVQPSPIFNSEHKSSKAVVRTCNGVSTNPGR